MKNVNDDTPEDDGLVPGSFGAGPSGTGPLDAGPSEEMSQPYDKESEPEPMSRDEFLADGGEHCPYCRSEDVSRNQCHTCWEEWDEDYGLHEPDEDILGFAPPSVLTFPEGTPDTVKNKVFSLIESFTPWDAEWRSDKGAILVNADEDPGEAQEMCETFEEVLSFISPRYTKSPEILINVVGQACFVDCKDMGGDGVLWVLHGLGVWKAIFPNEIRARWITETAYFPSDDARGEVAKMYEDWLKENAHGE